MPKYQCVADCWDQASMTYYSPGKTPIVEFPGKPPSKTAFVPLGKHAAVEDEDDGAEMKSPRDLLDESLAGERAAQARGMGFDPSAPPAQPPAQPKRSGRGKG